MIVLAIDQGTSGTKAVLLDDERVVASREATVRPRYLANGGVEVDPNDLLETVLMTGRAAVEAAGREPDVVALANQGETVLAWDRASGEAHGSALVWQDSRAASVCDPLAAHAERVHELTGLTLDPYFSAPKMRWLRDRVPDADVVTTTDSWMLHRLGGEFVTDATTASRSLVLDLDEARWSEELLDLFGLHDQAMPRVCANDEIVGTTTAFGHSAPIAGIVVDQQAALVAQGCLDSGTAKCTYGTGAFLLANTGPLAPRSPDGLTTSIATQTQAGRAYCLDGQLYAAGSTLRWLVDLGLLGSPDALDRTAAASAKGVTFVPGLAGLAAPWWQAQPCGAFLGMGLADGPGELVRAVVEGLAAHVAHLVTSVGSQAAPIARLQVDGGLTASRVLMQAQADLLQVPVDRHDSAHTTALGAAQLARLAMGEGDSLDDLVTRSVSETFEPQWSADRAEETMSRWRRAVHMTLEAQTA